MSKSTKDILKYIESKTLNEKIVPVDSDYSDGKRIIKIDQGEKSGFPVVAETTKPDFESFRKGAILLDRTDEDIKLLTDNQIKNDIMEYMLGNKKEIDSQIVIEEMDKKYEFLLLEATDKFSEEQVHDNYKIKAYKAEKEDGFITFNRTSTDSPSSVIKFLKDNISPKLISISAHFDSGEVWVKIINAVVMVRINGTVFTGNMFMKLDLKDINKSPVRIVNLIPASVFRGYSYFNSRRAMFLKGAVFNDNEEKSKEFFSVIKETLSSIKMHNTENNIIQSIIDSPIFDFTRSMETTEKMTRLSFALQCAFKHDMFLTEDEYSKLFNAYFTGEKDIDYVKEKFSDNVKKYKRNILSYVNGNEIFGLDNIPNSHSDFKKLIENDNIKKYLSKNALNVIKTREQGDFGKGAQYVKSVFSIPFGTYSQVDIDVKDIEERLNENVYGMDVVKRKILNHLAVMARSANAAPPVLCLSGPPGIGKTTICKILAESINRSFDMISCSGMSDSFSMMGVPYGYSNPEIGNIVKSLIKCGTMNPLILIDEIDKGSRGNHGSPEDALIPILDPGQNYRFEDRYIGFPIDISKVQFITTVNDLNALSEPLRDRMMVIEMDGYSDPEKMEIMKRFSIPKTMKDYNIKSDEVTITKKAMNQIIDQYGGEPGMRRIEAVVKEILARAVYLLECGKNKISVDNIADFIDNSSNRSIGF